MQSIDISGKWWCTSPDDSISKEVTLPGSSCENEIGKKQEYFDKYTKETVRAPREKYEYIGKLIYEKDIEIPKEWEDMNVYLFFERINIASELEFDGIKVGRGVIELTTPHIYKLTNRRNSAGEELIPSVAGKHHIKLTVDNSNILNMGYMASGYSIDTQGYWNGVIGKMELRAFNKDYVERIAVFTDGNKVKADVVLITDRRIPLQVKPGKIRYKVIGPDGRACELEKNEVDVELFATRQTVHICAELKQDDVKLWDEFEPNLYTIEVELIEEGTCVDTCKDTFGFRRIFVKDKRFFLNDKPLSLRGTINCAQYPLTGYPPMAEDLWERHFKTFKEHGLNHVRFHAWCPPEAAFSVADRLGIYLSIEMPLWLNWDISEMEFGEDEWHEDYYRKEAIRISEFFGNHPSFCFFSNGNENMGDFTMLESIIASMKAVDNRRLYTMTSNFDHPMSPAEDYISASDIYHMCARIQYLHDEVAENTCVNYDEMARKVPAPFTSFEVGQYVVYPNVDLCEKYTGNILPTNLDIIRKMMKEHGVYHKLEQYIQASGDLAAKLYKEDIEAVLRTKGMGGFQLLSLVDYTGQSTATVGLLDIFHENKGVISPEDFRQFCSEVVPLFQSKRIFLNTENLEATLSLYDYGKNRIENPVYELKMECDGKVIFENRYASSSNEEDKKVNISIPLSFVKENSFIKLSLSVGEYTNTYRIFVYKDEEVLMDGNVFVRTDKELDEAIAEGRNVIYLMNEGEKTYKNSFVPVFWSPVHFPSSKPCGAFINNKHSALNAFPTDKYIDYQWKDLLEHSVSMDISGREDIDIVMEMVPNFVDNVPKSPLFIKEYGSTKVVFSGFEYNPDSLTSKILYLSLCNYINQM